MKRILRISLKILSLLIFSCIVSGIVYYSCKWLDIIGYWQGWLSGIITLILDMIFAYKVDIWK